MADSRRPSDSALTGAAGLAAGLYSTLVAPRQLRIRRRAVAIAGLPAAFDGFTIAHVSDLRFKIPFSERDIRTSA